jgi:sporulation protein YlmC with PRC-barrel domain
MLLLDAIKGKASPRIQSIPSQSRKEQKVEIPIGAEVYCTDGLCGRSTYVIIDPASERVTHLVVKEHGGKGEEWLAPLDLVLETTAHSIRLRCARARLAALEPFRETEYIKTTVPYMGYPPTGYMMEPYAVPETLFVPVRHKHVPPDELSVTRGDPVEAKDGHIGRVDEFLVDPANGQITHLVLREGHLWGQKDVTIPVSEIDHIEEDTVYLKLDKHGVGELPSIALHRRLW